MILATVACKKRVLLQKRRKKHAKKQNLSSIHSVLILLWTETFEKSIRKILFNYSLCVISKKSIFQARSKKEEENIIVGTLL